MDLNTKLIIKVQFKDEIRKMPIHNEDITYDELIIMMERVFKHKLNAEDEMIIKYRDEDNDLIIISDDSDLAFAIETSSILKLSLTVENNSNDEENQNGDLKLHEIISIRKELQVIRDHANRLLDRLAHTNGDNSTNAITSGRTSATGGKDFQEIGGKEFDPLSITNHSQFQTVERTETASSFISNSRNEDNSIKSTSDQVRINQEIQSDSNEIHRPSPVKNQVPIVYGSSNQPPIQSSLNSTLPEVSSHMQYGMVTQNMPGKNIPGSMCAPNMPPSNIGQNLPNQNMVPNMGGQNMLPNMGNKNMPSFIGGQNMPMNAGGQNMPMNAGGQNMPMNVGSQNMPMNVGGQNMPMNVGGQNMPMNVGGQNMPMNVGGQNMPMHAGGQNMPMNVGGQNMPNIGGPNMPPHLGGQNMPPNIGNQNLPSVISKSMENQMHTITNAPSVYAGNSNSSIPGQQPNQRNYYPNAMQPPRPSNFQGPGNLQNRPPSGSPIFNPQTNNPQFNPHFGYQQPTQK